MAWAKSKAKEQGLDEEEGAKFIVTDYRDIPVQTFDKISCLEMAEHVGVKKFPAFMRQVYDMLEDDGLFYLQIAGEIVVSCLPFSHGVPSQACAVAGSTRT